MLQFHLLVHHRKFQFQYNRTYVKTVAPINASDPQTIYVIDSHRPLDIWNVYNTSGQVTHSANWEPIMVHHIGAGDTFSELGAYHGTPHQGRWQAQRIGSHHGTPHRGRWPVQRIGSLSWYNTSGWQAQRIGSRELFVVKFCHKRAANGIERIVFCLIRFGHFVPITFVPYNIPLMLAVHCHFV